MINKLIGCALMVFTSGCANRDIVPERPANSFEEAALIDQRDGELLDEELLTSTIEGDRRVVDEAAPVSEPRQVTVERPTVHVIGVGPSTQPRVQTESPERVQPGSAGSAKSNVTEAELVERAELAMYAAQARMDALRVRAWDVRLERRAELNQLAGRLATMKDLLQERLAKYRATEGDAASRREVLRAIAKTKEMLANAPAGAALLE